MRHGSLLLMVVLVFALGAGPVLCPPDTDNCTASLLHAFAVTVPGGAAAFMPSIGDRVEPDLAPSYRTVVADPAAPPPRA